MFFHTTLQCLRHVIKVPHWTQDVNYIWITRSMDVSSESLVQVWCISCVQGVREVSSFLLGLERKWLYWVFFLGCYTRSVLDAIVSSHSNRAWVDVALPNECMASSTSFWCTKQCEVAQHMSGFDDLTNFNDTLKRSSPHLGKKKWIVSNSLLRKEE